MIVRPSVPKSITRSPPKPPVPARTKLVPAQKTPATIWIEKAPSTLQGKITGLSAYGSAYHLRPGVQITSSGDLRPRAISISDRFRKMRTASSIERAG